MPAKQKIGLLIWSAAILAIGSFQGLVFAQNCACPCPCPTAEAKPNLQIKYVPLKYTAPGDGREMYAEYCATCHGKYATGEGRATPALTAPAPSLVNLEANNNGRFPDARVRRVLTENNIQAHRSVDMRSWWAEFRKMDKRFPSHADQRINMLIVYLHQIQVPEQTSAHLEGQPGR